MFEEQLFICNTSEHLGHRIIPVNTHFFRTKGCVAVSSSIILFEYNTVFSFPNGRSDGLLDAE